RHTRFSRDWSSDVCSSDLYGTGNAATTTLRRVGGTASQDGNDGVNASSHTYATIDVGAIPPPQPALAPAQTFSYCEGEDLSTATDRKSVVREGGGGAAGAG